LKDRSSASNPDGKESEGDSSSFAVERTPKRERLTDAS
jgi:hypothetical protein